MKTLSNKDPDGTPAISGLSCGLSLDAALQLVILNIKNYKLVVPTDVSTPPLSGGFFRTSVP